MLTFLKMKTITKFVSTLVVAAGLATVASATTGSVPVNYGDLILGFRSSATSTNLEVNLGAVSQFTQATAGSTFTVSNLNVADLETVFTANWNTSALAFGVMGTTGKTGSNNGSGPDGQPLSTLWLSWGTSLGAPAQKIASQQNFAVTGWLNLISTGNTASLALANNTILSNANSALVDATKAGSWTVSETTGTAFNGVGLTKASFETVGGFTGSTAFDLYELLPGSGSGSLVGVFTLTDTGTLSFTSSGLYAAAIPEPSTYAAIFGVAMLGFAGFRRRIQKKN